MHVSSVFSKTCVWYLNCMLYLTLISCQWFNVEGVLVMLSLTHTNTQLLAV